MKEETPFPTKQPLLDMPQSETTVGGAVSSPSAPNQSPAAVAYGLDKLEELNAGLDELEKAHQLNLLDLNKDSADYQIPCKRATARFTTKKSDLRRNFGIFLRNKGNHKTSNGVAVRRVKRNAPKDETVLQRGRDIMGMNKNEPLSKWIVLMAAENVTDVDDHVTRVLPSTSVDSSDYEWVETAQSVDRKNRERRGKESDIALKSSTSVEVDFGDAKNIQRNNYIDYLTFENVKMAKTSNKTKPSTMKKKHKASRTFKKPRVTAVDKSSASKSGGRRKKARSSGNANAKNDSSGVKDEDLPEKEPSSIDNNSGAAQRSLSTYSAWNPMGYPVNILRFDEENDEYVIQAEGKGIRQVEEGYIRYWVSSRELQRFERYGPLEEKSSDEQSSESDSESESDIDNTPCPTTRSRQALKTQRAVEGEKSRQRTKPKHERSLIDVKAKQESDA